MDKIVKKIKTLPGTAVIPLDYYDNDIAIIDDVRNFDIPETSKTTMNFMAICGKGKAQGNINGQTISLTKSQILICPPNTTLSDIMISPDIEVKAILFTNRILQTFLHEKIGVWNNIIYRHKMNTFTLYDVDIEFLNHFYELLRICIKSGKSNPYYIDMVQSLLRSGFIGLIGLIKNTLSTMTIDSKIHTDNLFQRFLEVLGTSETKHRSVASYADELCISAKHLTNICKLNSGKTANEWITEYVAEDIRYYLRQTELPIKQVCDTLGFPNPSFFGKYVKEHFGMTPAQFRTSNGI